ncbi:MAG: toast rack family protein, partial [Terriglobia bacterium]
ITNSHLTIHSHLDSGGSRLMEGSFRYSEKMGKPNLHYDVTGGHGRLTVESPKNTSLTGKVVNEWNLRMGSQTPLDLIVSVGAGNADVDVSRLPVRSVEVRAGAGELHLNVAGKYSGDVTVKVEAGAGSARIRLPRDMGAVVDATVGVGSVNVSGLTKRDGKYYNASYVEGKPAVRMQVRGAVGDVTLSVE